MDAPITTVTAQKIKYFIKDFFGKCDQINRDQETADLVTYTEESLHEKLHFLCSLYSHPNWLRAHQICRSFHKVT